MRAAVVSGFNALEVLNKEADDMYVNGLSTDGTASSPSELRSFARSMRSHCPSKRRTPSPSDSRTTTSGPASPRSPLAKVSEEAPQEFPLALGTATVTVSSLPSPVVKSRKRVSTLQLPNTIQQFHMWISNEHGEAIPAAYNQYGELAGLETLSVKPLVADQHTVTEMLRKIKIEFHSEFRARMREIILPQMDSRTAIRMYF